MVTEKKKKEREEKKLEAPKQETAITPPPRVETGPIKTEGKDVVNVPGVQAPGTVLGRDEFGNVRTAGVQEIDPSKGAGTGPVISSGMAVDPQGRTFLGLSPEEAQQIGGADPLGAQQAQADPKALALFQQYKGQPLPPDVVASMSPTELDAYQAIATGGFGAVTGLVGGAVAGGLAGAGIGAIPGAIIGAGIGLVNGVRNNIGAQLAGEIGGKTAELERVQQNLRAVITNVNQGANSVEGVEQFYSLVSFAQQSHAQLKIDTQRSAAKFTGKDGAAVLARFELLFGQTIPLMEQQLGQAIANPDPNKVLISAEEAETYINNK